MATSKEYTATIWYKITKGKPQPASNLWRVAIQSTLDAALQRLGDRVAADEGLYPILTTQYDLTLDVDGKAAVNNLSPVLLLSEPARRRWRVTMDNVRFSLKFLPNFHDLLNPPPTVDYYFYTVFNQSIYVRDSSGDIPVETALSIFGNRTPSIDDDELAVDGQLFDNLVDIGTAIIMETASLEEVIRQAETAVGTAPSPTPPTPPS